MNGNSPIAIHASGLVKHYLIYDRPQDRLKQFLLRGHKQYYREFAALNDVSFTIRKGETVGIVGRNGSGKSTLLQLICNILTPTKGELSIHGRVSALLELGAGFNPEFTGRENIYLNGAILGMNEADITARYDDIVNFSGLDPRMLEQPVKTYSSGMYVRLAFAVAVSTEPDILVVDEALAVGDEAFQRKCFARIHTLQRNGCTILFVSHAAQNILQLCNRALLIDRGELLMDGEPKPVLAGYHRMIYAAPDMQETIRNNIKSGEASPTRAEAAFDATLVPESQMSYDSRGATISNPRITTPDGRRVNLLSTGKRYCYQYEVNFEQTATSVRCGMFIKTKSGVELGGSATSGLENTIEEAAAGSTLTVSFAFDCNLLPGAYFLNAGASAMEHGERVFLHRIVDACMFRVVEGKADTEAGIVHFNIAPTAKFI